MRTPLVPHPTVAPVDGPVVIVVADGVGHAPAGPSNAVTQADTPALDALLDSPLSLAIAAHGTAVGLPTDDDMGNSEVGHNALGAGRIFDQGAKLVNQAITSGAVWETPVWKQATQHGRDHTLHLLGLHSDGNVHAHIDHVHALLHRAAADGVTRCRVHILLDGRDVAARSAQTYIEATEKVLAHINAEYADRDADFRIASGGGRMVITLDRYGADWPMVERGWRCHTFGEGRQFPTAAEAIDAFYAESDADGSNTGDQYLDPFVIADDGEPIGAMADGDAVMLWNFRGDRAIEISQTYDGGTVGFDTTGGPDVFFAGMLEYDGDLKVPNHYLVNPPVIDDTMGHYLTDAGLRCFAVSETQKFGHVTYFWNGNRSGQLDADLETYIEVASDNVPFDQAPEMKAAEIVDETIRLIESGDYEWGRINIANGDMVGHTGDLDATIVSMQALDAALARLITAVESAGGVVIFTADHGNADIMWTEKDGVRSPKTSHTLSAVPFVVHANDTSRWKLAPIAEPGLANVAATVITLLGFEPPASYEPSLIVANQSWSPNE